MSRFRLRADLTRLAPPEDGGAAALHDPVFDRRIDLGPATAALVRALEAGEDPLAGPAASRPRAERLLRRFILLGLTERDDETVTRMRAIRSGEARLTHAVLAGARFGCQGSGACCQGHRLGPLSDDDVARLTALGHDDAVTTLVRDDGASARYLLQRDGRCTFLLADNRCDLHARHGAAAKPALCRLYPIERVATLDGIKLYDKGSCASFPRSARAGLPLAEQLGELRADLPEPAPMYHPVVQLDDEVICDYGHFLPFIRCAIDLVEQRVAGPGATLRAIHQRLLALRHALATFPLDEAPEAAREAALTADLDGEAPSEGLMREGAELLSVVAADLEEHAGGDGIRAAFGPRLAADMAAAMGRLKRAAIDISEGAPPLPLDPETLRLSLRQQLFGPRALVADRPTAGLLRMAILLAAGDDHSLAARLFEVGSAQRVLIQHEELAPTILAGLPLIVDRLGASA